MKLFGLFEWTVDNTPQPDVFEDSKTKILTNELTEGKTVYFHDFFGICKGVVIDDNYIRSGGNLWKAEKIKGGWHIIYGMNEQALSKIEITP
jgi:hypothetical protein